MGNFLQRVSATSRSQQGVSQRSASGTPGRVPSSNRIYGSRRSISFEPERVECAAQDVGSLAAPRQAQLRNLTAWPVVLSELQVHGDHAADFSVYADTSAPLEPGESRPVDVIFAPTEAQARNAQVSALADDGFSALMTLMGIGRASEAPQNDGQADNQSDALTASPGDAESEQCTPVQAPTPTQQWESNVQTDAEALLAPQTGSPNTSASTDWHFKLANRLALAFDSMKDGVTFARRVLSPPSGNPPDNDVLEQVIGMALMAMGGPTTSIIRRLALQVLPKELVVGHLVSAVKGVVDGALESGVRAVVGMAEDKRKGHKEAPGQFMLDRFVFAQQIALNRAKGDALDAFSDKIRPVLADTSPTQLAALHRELINLSGSAELGKAQAAETIVAWTTYLAHWHHGSFSNGVDVWQYRDYGNGGWPLKLKEGSMQIELEPMVVPDVWAGVFEGQRPTIKSLKIHGISDKAKALLNQRAYVGDLYGLLTFVSFQARIQKLLPASNITMVRQPNGEVVFGPGNQDFTADWLERYYGMMLGAGSATDGARDIFRLLDGTPLPQIE